MGIVSYADGYAYVVCKKNIIGANRERLSLIGSILPNESNIPSYLILSFKNGMFFMY